MFDSLCSADSNAVIAYGTVVLAVTAVITAICTVIALYRQSSETKASIEVDVLLRLDDVWRSPRMITVRSAAAAELFGGHPDGNVDEVLDFLESLALFLKRGVLDEEITWHTFYWPMANYWMAAEEYAQRIQREEGSATWDDLPKAVTRLRAVEARKSKRATAVAPTQEQNREFLQEEETLIQADER